MFPLARKSNCFCSCLALFHHPRLITFLKIRRNNKAWSLPQPHGGKVRKFGGEEVTGEHRTGGYWFCSSWGVLLSKSLRCPQSPGVQLSPGVLCGPCPSSALRFSCCPQASIRVLEPGQAPELLRGREHSDQRHQRRVLRAGGGSAAGREEGPLPEAQELHEQDTPAHSSWPTWRIWYGNQRGLLVGVSRSWENGLCLLMCKILFIP